MEKLADDLLLRSQFIKLLILTTKEGYVKSIILHLLNWLVCLSHLFHQLSQCTIYIHTHVYHWHCCVSSPVHKSQVISIILYLFLEQFGGIPRHIQKALPLFLTLRRFWCDHFPRQNKTKCFWILQCKTRLHKNLSRRKILTKISLRIQESN